MKHIFPLIVFFLISPKIEAQEVSFLKLKQAFKYENNKNVPEFSGLCIKDGSLYSINDKNENYLYKLNMNTVESTFKVNSLVISKGIDFEGICYYNNSFFAIDERHCKVYKIFNNTVIEYSKEFLKNLDSQKLIDKGEGGNKQIESFSMLDDSTFIIATERSITTLAKINIQGKVLSKTKIPPLHYNDSCLPTPLTLQKEIVKDANSFSDLCIFQGKAYLLEREKKLIYVVDISTDQFVITKTLSFKNGIIPCEEDHPYYGAAEGVAIDDKYIYIILDNNGDDESKVKHMCDKNRRTLFQFYNTN
jgi:hypothetical protein